MKHVYFREDTQELKFLPIEEENCYYLGEFTDRQAILIKSYLQIDGKRKNTHHPNHPCSFLHLAKLVKDKAFR